MDVFPFGFNLEHILNLGIMFLSSSNICLNFFITNYLSDSVSKNMELNSNNPLKFIFFKLGF